MSYGEFPHISRENVTYCGRCEYEQLGGCGGAHLDRCLANGSAKCKGDEFEDILTTQETVLQEADRITRHARGKNYGHPYVDFQKVVGMAMALWGRGPESPEEHALYMILVKLARLEATPGHHDSIVDIAGYIKTYDMVIQEKVSRLTANSV